jgi:ATP-binding cassette subfamily F protein uup
LLDKFDYVFKKGERIGVIGKNGTGKSTFLNLITGALPVDSGKVVIGETTKFGYYTQEGIEVKPGQKVIEVIREYGDYIPLAKGRTLSAGQLLERFLFDRKKQYDYVEKLSGGELKRLFLCTVLIGNPNFLLLDEPTNDLDIVTLQVLENFLLDFPGNLIVVSHDRYFMDRIVDHLFVFEGDGNISDFPGNYSDYRAYEDSRPPDDGQAPPQKFDTRKAPPAEGELSHSEKKEFKRLEKDIIALEKKKQEIEELFASEDLNPEDIEARSIELKDIMKILEEKEERWLELSLKKEEPN